MRKHKKAPVAKEDVFKTFWTHLKEQRPVTLHNRYHGVPISYEAEVALATPEYVGLVVHPYQTVGIKQERRTYLESKSLPVLIRALPVSVDYTNLVVLLKKLKGIRPDTVDRKHSRIRPKRPGSVSLQADDGTERDVGLLEISALGDNVIHVTVSVPEDLSCSRQDSVRLVFALSKTEHPIQVDGVVQSLTKVRKRPEKRLVVDGRAAMEDEISILAYIAAREDEIMADLDRTYKRLRSGKGRRQT
jgi:type IV secretory pathway protease TraF